MSLKSALYLAFRMLARWRLPALAARLLLVTTRPLSGQRNAHSDAPKSHRALILTREGFVEDVVESFAGADDYDLVCWPSFAVKAFAAEILSPTLDHNNYISADPAVENSKQAYRTFLAQLWKYYTRKKLVDVVLTGNFAYFSERELGAVLEQAGTPFIALHKENVRPPRRVKEYWFKLYQQRRGKFTGHKIFVYNEVERDLEISSGIIEPENVLVTGMPRLDRIHRWRREHAGKPRKGSRPQILFFAFSRQDKLTAIQRKAAAGLPGNIEDMAGDWGNLSWGRFCEDTHNTIVDLARKRPDFDILFKSKGQSRKLTDIMQMLEQMEHPLPPNLKVVASGHPFEMIADADVIVGFNTTGLLEAIAAGKPVIVPSFGEAREEKMQDLIIDLGDAVEYAYSPDELAEMVCHFAENPREIPAELPAEASRVLRYWVGNDDGDAGRRVLAAINNEVKGANPL